MEKEGKYNKESENCDEGEDEDVHGDDNLLRFKGMSPLVDTFPHIYLFAFTHLASRDLRASS